MATIPDTEPGCCPADAPQTLGEFLAALDEHRGRIPLDELRIRLSNLKISVAEIHRHARFGNDRYQRNLLHAGPAYQALILCWRSGQRSPIHDHTGSSCGVKVLLGTATETVFDRTALGHIFAIGSGRLAVNGVCATQDSDIHQVSNLESGDLITLHVYSPPLLCMNTYSLTDTTIAAFHDPVMTCFDGDGI